jgi:uncharacterized protein (DUF305 family)
MKENHYRHLLAMAVLSFGAMYVLMYAMVDTVDDVYMNVNQIYMAGLMTAPMIVIELLVMRGMYHNPRLNGLIIAGSVIGGLLMLLLIRQQTGVSDRQFLRSMIPHHSGAILMCEEASLEDRRIQELCKAIIAGQRAEIEQMRTILQERKPGTIGISLP